ncbi:hypothetical protein V1477_016345 [Vespula maculifrons]|uniref:Uncharacterized protein n=1 Tax=Vespula maculifrons TaxID=7453 RepID=A0ABD2BCR6_VESMC
MSSVVTVSFRKTESGLKWFHEPQYSKVVCLNRSGKRFLRILRDRAPDFKMYSLVSQWCSRFGPKVDQPERRKTIPTRRSSRPSKSSNSSIDRFINASH